jgi:hypothetical protein
MPARAAAGRIEAEVITVATRIPKRAGAPSLERLPDRRVAVVRTGGDPASVGQEAIKRLYGAVYRLKFARKKEGRDFKVEPLRARWANAHLAPRDEWEGIWALPIPDDATPEGVETDLWAYGPVAAIVHRGSFATEAPTIERLHAFIEENGYEIAGPHEEEYLTRPDAKNQRTRILYRIREKG